MIDRSKDRSHLGMPEPPRLELLFESILYPPREAENLGVSSGRQRLLTDVAGFRIEGPRMHGRFMPGSQLIQVIFPNGIREEHANVGIEMDDGHRLLGQFAGVCMISPEHAWELSQGMPYDAERGYLRVWGRLEAADDSPYSWLNRSLLVGKWTGVHDSAVWQLL